MEPISSTPSNSTPARVNQVKVIPKQFTLTPAATNFASWVVAPLTNVASNTGGLESYAGGWDRATGLRGDAQYYSSYACQSSSFISRCDAVSQLTETLEPATQQQPDAEIIPDIPTPAELAALSVDKQNAYMAGELTFVRAYGFLTVSQIERKMANLAKAPTIHVNNAVRLEALPNPHAQVIVQRTDQDTDGSNDLPAPTDPAQQSPPQGSAQPSGVSTAPAPAVSVSAQYLGVRIMTPTHVPPATFERHPPYSNSYALFSASLDDDQQTAIKSSVKSPIVRDTTVWYSLTKALSQEGGEFRDCAPMMRTAILQAAISDQIAKTDWTPHTFMRNMIPRYTSTSIGIPVSGRPASLLIAMPLDTFSAHINGDPLESEPPNIFSAAGMDTTWVGIPVDNAILSSRYIMEYIAMFLSTELTFGSISHTYSYLSDQKDIRGTYTTMPAANLTHVPGALNAILILTDTTAMNSLPQVTARNLTVPVYNGKQPRQAQQGQQRATAPVNFTVPWTAWFSTANITPITENLCRVWNTIMEKIAVDETPGIAISLAAEATATMRPGMLLHATKQVGYDGQRPLAGAYALRRTNQPATQKLAVDNPYSITVVGLSDQNATNTIRKLMTGFNYAVISPWHIPPTGIVECHPHEGTGTVTSEPKPNALMSSSFYSIPVASTLKRLAAFSRLITTTPQTYPFHTPAGMSSFIKILAQAVSANTVSMLLAGDVPVRDWSGYNDLMGKMSKSVEMSSYKQTVTSGILRHQVMLDVHSVWLNYDDTAISDYYGGIDPYDSRAWLSHSPVPSHLTLQWTQKLNILPNAGPTDLFENVAVKKNTYFMHPLNKDNRQETLYYLTSFDTAKSIPILVDRTQSDKQIPATYSAWIEQVSHLSQIVTTKREIYRKYTSTTTNTEAISVSHSVAMKDRSLYVYDAPLHKAQWLEEQPRVNQIQYPDPPEWTTLLGNAKNYLDPAVLAALCQMTEALDVRLHTPARTENEPEKGHAKGEPACPASAESDQTQ